MVKNSTNPYVIQPKSKPVKLHMSSKSNNLKNLEDNGIVNIVDFSRNQRKEGQSQQQLTKQKEGSSALASAPEKFGTQEFLKQATATKEGETSAAEYKTH